MLVNNIIKINLPNIKCNNLTEKIYNFLYTKIMNNWYSKYYKF